MLLRYFIALHIHRTFSLEMIAKCCLPRHTRALAVLPRVFRFIKFPKNIQSISGRTQHPPPPLPLANVFR
uniref:Putative secreted protein n=1 Tax=Anopheles darlingi TaxID=43151 RepID=A0A2M4DNJ9_ANODA